MSYKDVVRIACANVRQLPADRPDDLSLYLDFIAAAGAQAADLIVFPETTFSAAGQPLGDAAAALRTHAELAEPIPGPTTAVLGKAAREQGIHVVAGMLERDTQRPEGVYNAAAVIGPSGDVIGVHRKVHLFKTEKAFTTPGDAFTVVETDFGPVGVLICSDFYCYPEAARVCALKGARLILLVTAVMVTLIDLQGQEAIYEGAIELVPDIIRVRAYENHIYIAAANAVGTSLSGYRAFGKSMIVGPHPPGSFAVKYFAGPASQVDNELIVATLDLKAMDAMRRRLWENRVPPLYGAIGRHAADA